MNVNVFNRFYKHIIHVLNALAILYFDLGVNGTYLKCGKIGYLKISTKWFVVEVIASEIWQGPSG